MNDEKFEEVDEEVKEVDERSEKDKKVIEELEEALILLCKGGQTEEVTVEEIIDLKTGEVTVEEIIDPRTGEVTAIKRKRKTKTFRPDCRAVLFYLTNRAPEHWSRKPAAPEKEFDPMDYGEYAESINAPTADSYNQLMEQEEAEWERKAEWEERKQIDREVAEKRAEWFKRNNMVDPSINAPQNNPPPDTPQYLINIKKIWG
jgi:hypothetical protein